MSHGRSVSHPEIRFSFGRHIHIFNTFCSLYNFHIFVFCFDGKPIKKLGVCIFGFDIIRKFCFGGKDVD
jgi:hypothetical protein